MVNEALGRVINRYEIDSRIVKTIAFNPFATIDLIAKKTGLSYTAVRNGLQRLVALGVITETEATGGPGRRGRPAALFSLERGLRIQIPPRKFDHLADILIEQLIREDGTDQVHKLLDRAAKLQATKLIKSWKESKSFPRSADQMVARFCDFINSQGCFAKHFVKNGEIHIQVNNCIYSEISTNYPGTICHFHSNLIEYLLEPITSSFTLTHEKAIAKGDLHCVFVLVQP